MSVRASILGVLTIAPTYGHQILFEIESRLPHRRGVNPGQVYSTLGRLVSSGHLTSEDATPGKLPLYHLTDVGRLEANLWLEGTRGIDVDDWSEVMDAVLLCASLPDASIDRLISAIRVTCSSPVAPSIPGSGATARVVTDATRIHRQGILTWLDGVTLAIASGELTPHLFADDRPGRGRRPKPIEQTQTATPGD